jgi:Flp pilus assembly secretin CpaC
MANVRVRGQAGTSLIRWLAAASLIFNVTSALAAQPIVVLLDQARLIELPQGAATAVIGDPLIADLSIQAGGVAVITGKGFGTTNLIVLDRDGAVLAEQTIKVMGAGNPVVVVDRDDPRPTYRCTS